MKKLILVAFVLAIVSTCLAIITDSMAGEVNLDPLVITKKVEYPDPLLEHDFSMTEYPAPPPYDPKSKTDPFLVIVAAEDKVVMGENTVVKVPDTPLTKHRVSQFTLTSVIVNHTFAYAYFTAPGDPRVIRSEKGNYIGKEGYTISDIKYGEVHLSNGAVLALNK